MTGKRVPINRKTGAKLAVGRAAREPGWSLLVIGVLASGFSAWIIIPSIGTSLQANLVSYANGAATYLAVAPTGGCNSVRCYSTIPQQAIRAVSTASGVQAVYPFAINSTYFVARNFSTTENGRSVVIPRARFGVTSAVFGGPYGFPTGLLALSGGRLPGNEPSFVYQTYVPLGSNFPPEIQVGLNKTAEVVIGCLRCPTGNITTVGPYFNATGNGIISSNFLFSSVAVMWNWAFLADLLGPRDFNQTFGPGQTNYMIVKVDSVADVPEAAAELSFVLEQYPPYQLYYDQAFFDNTKSFVSRVAPLYQVFGLISFIAVVAVSLLMSNFVAGKRSWEAGMLLTQGWAWGDIAVVYFAYFLLLSLISFLIAGAISIAVSRLFTANYVVYGQAVTFTAYADPTYVFVGLMLALVLPPLEAWTIIKRLRGTELDKILSEY
jgi:hypothetical protein